MNQTGVIKKKFEKGFGFIQGADGTDYFFHMSSLQTIRFDQISEGDSVLFDSQPSIMKPGQKEAVKVRAASANKNQIAHPAQSLEAANSQVAAAETYPPYRFVPIDTEQAVTDTPVWHDGNGGGELLSGELLCTLEALTPLLSGNDRFAVGKADARKLEEWGFAVLLEDTKQIAEPLRLKDGRVVIAGSALKGMFRHSLGALLSAPMERVAERHFTYRPNLDFSKNTLVRDTRPAIIIALSSNNCEVKVLTSPWSAVFRSHKKPDGAVSFPYCGGIDGEGILAGVAQKKTYVYQTAFVSGDDIKKAVPLPIRQEVLAAYEKTQEVLSKWHVSETHPSKFDRIQVAQAIGKATPLKIGQLIYVEVAIDVQTKVPKEILSLGHHFRYRWAYSSSIREKAGNSRSCLTPLESEKKSPPEKFSGARLLFGYVRDADNPIGDGVYKRLAGRIAINHAVSVGIPDFLGEEKTGYCIALPILGQPKPSAWEFYLTQKPGSDLPATYGDLPGDAGGDLAGRKFYLHQTGIRDAKSIGSDTLPEKLATLARFVCAPQTKFRFTLRFARLRRWELGALLAVLQPQQLDTENKDDKEYAHKLGLGRPLGMGSVRISVDKLRVRCEKETRLTEQPDLSKEAVGLLRAKLNAVTLKRWLEIHRYVNYGKVGYPLRTEPKPKWEGNKKTTTQETTIYHWHTNIRKEYSKLRREASPNASNLLKSILCGQTIPPIK